MNNCEDLPDFPIDREPLRASSFSLEDDHPAAPPEDFDVEPQPAPDPESLWKQEVASRLENYRSRRGTRRPRYNGTLSLDFDRAANRMMAAALPEEDPPEPANEFFGAASCEPEIAPMEQAADFGPVNEFAAAFEEEPDLPPPPPAPKIIEFPRLPTLFDPAPSGSELAESVIDKPRILYVPEEVPTSQAPLADIQLPPDEPLVPENFELPLTVAPMGQRLLAGIADGVVVLVSAFVFMAIVVQAGVPAPDSRVGYVLVATLPTVLWTIYEYFFLVHCGVTPGMQTCKLAVASFASEPVGRQTRRARALASMLSVFPLGLGVVWALLDDDTLCWHDRISRTYLIDRTSFGE